MNDLDELLGRARGVVASPSAKARLRGRVLGAAVVAGVASPATASAAAKLAVSVGKVPLLGFLLYVAGGVAISALALGPLALFESASRAKNTSVAPVQSSSAVRQALSAAMAPTSAPVGELAAQPPVAPTLPVASSKSSKSAPLPPPSIDREMLLLGEAQRELRRGAPEAALGWLARYEAEFPSGALAEEAAAVRAISACSRSATQRSAELERFRARFPTSALAPRVGRACSISHDDFELGSPVPATQIDEARPVGSGAEGELR